MVEPLVRIDLVPPRSAGPTDLDLLAAVPSRAAVGAVSAAPTDQAVVATTTEQGIASTAPDQDVGPIATAKDVTVVAAHDPLDGPQPGPAAATLRVPVGQVDRRADRGQPEVVGAGAAPDDGT